MDKNKLNLGRTFQSHLGRKIHKKHLHVPPSTRCNLQFISEEKHSKSGSRSNNTLLATFSCKLCLISLFDVFFNFLFTVTYDFLNLLRDWRIFRVKVWIF
ncbi:hypothetical protein Peur_063127 [Populus x canadensis]